MAGANPSPMVWNGQRIHPFARGINTKKNLKKTKVVQSAWCELCKIDCNSQDILNNHRLGKKHMKNLRKLEESKNVVATEPVATMVPQQPTLIKEIPSGEGAHGKKMKMKQISTSKPEEDIETKRRKLMEGGTAADSLRVCTICNVVCNSETVFHLHLAGQKHAAKVTSAPERKEPMIGPIPNPNPNQIQIQIQNPLICNDQPSLPTLNGGMGKKKKKKSKTSEVMRPLRCELCQIDCSSQDILNRHNVGKRHNKNLEKVELWKNKAVAAAAVVTPNPTAFAATASVGTPNPTAFAAAAAATFVNPNPTAAVVNPNSEAGMKTAPEQVKEKTARGKAKRKKLASTFRPGVDLETKKRKLLECGTTADSVKVCTVCNVVCNSETVYRYHLAGQKHATLLKKQMMKQTPATATLAVGPQLITSTMATVGPQPSVAVTVTAPVGPHPVTSATVAPTSGP